MSRKPFGTMADAFVNGHFGTAHIRGWIYRFIVMVPVVCGESAGCPQWRDSGSLPDLCFPCLKVVQSWGNCILWVLDGTRIYWYLLVPSCSDQESCTFCIRCGCIAWCSQNMQRTEKALHAKLQVGLPVPPRICPVQMQNSSNS